VLRTWRLAGTRGSGGPTLRVQRRPGAGCSWDARASCPCHGGSGERGKERRAMASLWQSKKLIVSVLGLAAVVVLVVLDRDFETVKWVGGFVTGIVASLNIGQGIADGFSEGRTSASARTSEGQ